MGSGEGQAKSSSDEELLSSAIRFVLAMLRSADPEVIGPKKWWTRAKTALETSAACADSWPQMVSRCGAKLQVMAPGQATSVEVFSLGEGLRDEETFEKFRHLCQRDALYIVAMARAQKEQEKKDGEDLGDD